MNALKEERTESTAELGVSEDECTESTAETMEFEGSKHRKVSDIAVSKIITDRHFLRGQLIQLQIENHAARRSDLA